MADSGTGRPGPALMFGVPLIILGAAGFFGWTKLVKPALEARQEQKTQAELNKSTSLSGKTRRGKMLKIAGDPWSGYSTFRDEPRLTEELARRDVGLDYQTDEKFFDQNERMKALADGTIDLAVTTVDAFLQHGAKHKKDGLYPGVILWNIDESAGGDAIFLEKGKKSFDDVKPTDKVCFATGTPSEHLWDFASLSFTAIENLKTDNGVVAKDCWEKLKAGKVQVAVLWQPFTAIAEKDGYPKVFATGGQADDVIVDVLVASRNFVINDKATLQALANDYFKVIDGYVKDPDAHAQFITKDCGTDCGGDTKLGRAVLDGIDFLTYEENACLWWGQCGTPNKMLTRLQKTGRLVAAKGKISSAELPDPSTVLNDSFLVAMKAQLDQKAKLAAEVAGQNTPAAGPKLDVKEKTYQYAADTTKNQQAADVGTLRLPNIYFSEGKSEMDANARSVVDGIADRLKSFPALCVRVYGHTNSTGNPEANRRLSQQRAESIVNYLKSTDGLSFPSARFDVRGFGSDRPIMNGAIEDKDQSRRTEFKLFNCNAGSH